MFNLTHNANMSLVYKVRDACIIVTLLAVAALMLRGMGGGGGSEGEGGGSYVVEMVDKHDTTHSKPRMMSDVKPHNNNNNNNNNKTFHTTCNGRKPGKFHGQGQEDKALWKKFFSNPPLCNGTFVELGALDGVRFSNTLMYERDLGWRGILIEGAPNDFKKLQHNHRQAILHHKAICPRGQGEVEFVDSNAVGGIKDEMTDNHLKQWKLDKKTTVKVPCAQLGTLIKQAGFTHVDLLSLDVEGAELMVLKTLDWNVPIHVMLIDMTKHQQDIRQLLDEKGYRCTLPEWNIRTFCPVKKACPANEVFVNVRWEQQRSHKLQQTT